MSFFKQRFICWMLFSIKLRNLSLSKGQLVKLIIYINDLVKNRLCFHIQINRVFLFTVSI
ncbi:hypothetical protein ABW12_06825 [Pluralibacter gergoviae]|nr:hypothetical protein ABW12_06825 [Pluralibacter gergoviae]